MRLTIPLICLVLAGCNPPLEELFPPRNLTYEMGERVVDVRAQYDPIDFGWVVRLSDRNGRFEQDDREAVQGLVAERMSPELCEADERLEPKPGKVITGFGATRERYLPQLGDWQIVFVCA